MRSALEREQFEVVEAVDGEDALDKLDGRQLGLIVTDLAMPRMDGLSFLRYLRQHPRYKFTPLLVWTTETRTQMRQKAREADYEKAEYLIKADKCEEAIPLLKGVVADNPKDADALNFLGFCHRKTGKLKESLAYYEQALAVNPTHKGAHEYLGELYLRMGDLPKAEGQLKILQGLCPSGCEELEDLEADIADFKANGGKLP
jgi:CheY-like chemotaxis protein